MVYQLKVTEFSGSSLIGYPWSEQRSNSGGIAQRWLVVESSFRGESDRRKLEINIQKAELYGHKKLRQLSNIEFACLPDASSAAHRLSQELKDYNLSQISSP
jgi:hypothetical protein